MRTEADSTFSVTRDDRGSVAVVTLLRPQSLDIAGKRALTDLFVSLAADQHIRAVVLASEQPAALLVDVAELAHMTPAAALVYSRAGQALMDAVEAVPAPVIAAVSGAALGGGCELVLACDLALCSDEATFGQIEAGGGVVPAFGGTWRLVRRVGYQRACQMIFTAAILDAETAKAHGLVLEVLSASALLARCRELAAQICSSSRASVAEAKHILTASSGREPALANAMEQAGFAAMFGTADQQTRMDSFLNESAGREAGGS